MKFTIIWLFILQLMLCAQEYVIPLGQLGSIRYIYDDNILLNIDRLSPSGELMYTHGYNYENKRLVSENLIGDLGQIIYAEQGVVKSPYHLEICEYNDAGNLVKHTYDSVVREYSYNNLNELISEGSRVSYEYNLVGNLIRKGDIYFSYDEENRLVKSSSHDYDITYTYDALGRRVSRTINGEQENYCYFGMNEMLVFDSNNEVQELRIPGQSHHKDLLRPIAIETKNAIYAPIHDVQGNIVKLIDITTREVMELDLPDPFGMHLSKNAPTGWIFSGKHYDKEVDLIYFGHRYYSPELKKWLSPDPAEQSSDLHQYCLNNPLIYFDPDGQFVIAIPLVWMGGVALTEILVDAAVVAGVSWLGHKAIQKGNQWSDKRVRDYPFDEHSYDSMMKVKEKKGKQKDATPQSNDAQNNQFDGAVREIEKKLGKKLTHKDRRRLHQGISKQNYGYHELVEEGYWMFYGQ